MVVNKYSSGLLDATVETFQSSLLSTIYINKTNALRALDKANCVFCCNGTECDHLNTVSVCQYDNMC
ncbi:unnamed protein product [Rotaria magnacalcarata]